VNKIFGTPEFPYEDQEFTAAPDLLKQAFFIAMDGGIHQVIDL
jgi:hypothetical protein